MIRCSLFVLVVAGSLIACRGGSRDAAPPCSAVAAKFLGIARHDLDTSGVDEATARAVADQLPAMRDALGQACSDGKWGPQVRTCLVAANDHVGFEQCEQQLTDEQRRDLSRATSPAPDAPH